MEKRLPKVCLLLGISLFISSCCSNPEPIIVKEKVNHQEVTFPEFPVFYADQIDYSEDMVLVPEWLWVEISMYQLDVKKTEELYLLFRQ